MSITSNNPTINQKKKRKGSMLYQSFIGSWYCQHLKSTLQALRKGMKIATRPPPTLFFGQLIVLHKPHQKDNKCASPNWSSHNSSYIKRQPSLNLPKIISAKLDLNTVMNRVVHHARLTTHNPVFMLHNDIICCQLSILFDIGSSPILATITTVVKISFKRIMLQKLTLILWPSYIKPHVKHI